MPPGPRPRPGGFLPLKRLCVARRASRLGRLEAPALHGFERDIDTTLAIPRAQLRCNAGQTREGEPAHLCGTCKPVQTPATSELSLVGGARKRFESTTRLTVWCHLP